MQSFFVALFENGNVHCAPPTDSIGDAERAALSSLLVAREHVYRAGFPGRPPPFSLEVAVWAAISFYRACQAATYRDLDEPALHALLDVPPPTLEPVSRHYSVDLIFQFLTDLYRMAWRTAPGDPLVGILGGWANQWPLSSVGIEGAEPASLDGIVEHAGLLQSYVDRIVLRRDVSRLTDPRVQAAVRRSILLHRNLFPEFAILWQPHEPVASA